MKTYYALFISSCLFILGTSSLDFRNVKNVNAVKKENYEILSSRKTEKYIITSVLFNPFLNLKEGENGTGNDAFEGYIKDLADILAEKIGFQYELRLSKDSHYGMQDSNGEWNGMIGELIRNEANIAIAPLTITSERQMVVEFSIPFMTTGVSVMIKQPSFIDDQNFLFLTPFTKELWISIMFSCVAVAVVFFIVNKFSSYNWKTQETSEKISVKEGLNSKIFNTLKTILQQQNESRNRSVSAKIIASVFCFFVIVLIASYTATLSVFLTSKISYSPIQSVEDLPNQPDVQYGVIRGGSTQKFFQNSNSHVYSRMWNFMKLREENFVSSSKEGVEKVRNSNGKYAFILEGVVNDYVNERQPCDTIRLGPNLNSIRYGIAVAKGNSLLRERLDNALIELGTDGTLNEIKNRWWSASHQCKRNSLLNKTLEPISLWKVAGLFYILFSGIILALLVAVCEYCLNSKQGELKIKGELL